MWGRREGSASALVLGLRPFPFRVLVFCVLGVLSVRMFLPPHRRPSRAGFAIADTLADARDDLQPSRLAHGGPRMVADLVRSCARGFYQLDDVLV